MVTITGVYTNTIEISKKEHENVKWLRIDCGNVVIFAHREDNLDNWAEVIVDWPSATVEPVGL